MHGFKYGWETTCWIRFYFNQCCGSSSLWCGSGFDLSPWCGSGFWFLFDADVDEDPDPTFHPDVDLDPDPSFQDSNPWKSAQIGSYSIRFGLSTANWCGSGTSLSILCVSGCGCGSWFLFDAADPRYQNDVDPCGSGSTTLTITFGRQRRCMKEASSSYLSLQGGFLVHNVAGHVGL